MRDDFIERWRARLAGALDDALAHLAAHQRSPYSDGVLGDWVRQLRTFPVAEHHLPHLLALIGKPDPHLQEAGVQLAEAALSHLDCADAIEPAIAALLARPVDSWVLEAIIDLLHRSIGPLGPQFTSIYRALIALPPGARAAGDGIQRNRYINPRARLLTLYQQHALQTIEPTDRDLLLLPLLEARHGTRGWRETQLAILAAMGLDPAQHFRALRGRP
jgi:hypothetical protein